MLYFVYDERISFKKDLWQYYLTSYADTLTKRSLTKNNTKKYKLVNVSNINQ